MLMIAPFLVTPAAQPTRASTATYLDAAGVLRYAAVDEVRPILETTGSTNRVNDANAFTNSTGTTVATTTSVKAPDAIADAVRVTCSATTGEHRAEIGSESFSGGSQPIGASVFVRKGTLTRVKIVLRYSASYTVRFSALLDLVSGTVVATTGTGTVQLEACTDGWYRVKINSTSVSGQAHGLRVYLDNGSGSAAESTTFTGTTSQYAHVWGAQIEAGAVSSYIPTSGSEVTRAPDVLPAAVAGVSDLLSSNVPIDDHAAWSAGTAYTTGQRVIVTGYTDIWECVTGNTGVNPTTDTSGKWLLVGKINRWRMFDKYMGSQTALAEAIGISVRPGAACDCLVLFGLVAASVRVAVNDLYDGEVYQREFQTMVKQPLQTSTFYDYLHNVEVEAKDILVVSDLPLSRNCTVTVQINMPGGTAKVGMCLFGRGEEIGTPEWGATVGISDYSQVSRDTWGNPDIVERTFSDKAHMQIVLPTKDVPRVKKLLASRRAKATVFMGHVDYPSTIVYGFPKDFDQVLKGVAWSDYQLTVEGLPA